MKRCVHLCALLAVAATLTAAGSVHASDPIEEQTRADGIYAILQTDLGDIVCWLAWREAPLTVANFVGLAEGTRSFLDPKTGELVKRPFYDGLLFHRVVQGFMIQTGDPTGRGDGGPGYRFRDEFSPDLKHDRPGILSMANTGPATNGSQFFITEKAAPWLDGKNSVFGRVLSGMDVVEAIASVSTEKERPVQEIHLRRVRIIRRGKDARHFDAEATFARLKDLGPSEIARMEAERFEARMERLQKKSHRVADGIRYTITHKGKGDKPRPGEAIRVHYVCYLPDGRIVESTRRSGRPMQLVAGKPRRGLDWEMQFLQMKPGEERWVFLSPEMAFGHRGIPGVVPPDSPVILRLELVDIPRSPGSKDS